MSARQLNMIIILVVYAIIATICWIWQRKTESAVPIVIGIVTLIIASILVFIV